MQVNYGIKIFFLAAVFTIVGLKAQTFKTFPIGLYALEEMRSELSTTDFNNLKQASQAVGSLTFRGYDKKGGPKSYGMGSAFLSLHNDVLYVDTAYHVLDTLILRGIETFVFNIDLEGKPHQISLDVAQLQARNNNAIDFARFKVASEENGLDKSTIARLKNNALSWGALPTVGERVFSLGNPKIASSLRVSAGHILSVYPKEADGQNMRFFCSCSAAPGSSGGPVLRIGSDGKVEVVGVNHITVQNNPTFVLQTPFEEKDPDKLIAYLTLSDFQDLLLIASAQDSSRYGTALAILDFLKQKLTHPTITLNKYLPQDGLILVQSLDDRAMSLKVAQSKLEDIILYYNNLVLEGDGSTFQFALGNAVYDLQQWVGDMIKGGGVHNLADLPLLPLGNSNAAGTVITKPLNKKLENQFLEAIARSKAQITAYDKIIKQVGETFANVASLDDFIARLQRVDFLDDPAVARQFFFPAPLVIQSVRVD